MEQISKPSRRRRIIFWVILVTFVVSGVWWSFYLPYDEAALYRAVPANALIITEHDDLADRYHQILRNSAVKRSLHLLGDNSLSADRLARDKSLKWACNRFMSKKTVLAFVPMLAYSAEYADRSAEAWVFASWVGGNEQLLKRGLISREMPELKKERLEDGLTIWTLAKEHVAAGDMSLSIGVYDGVLIGCLSEDPKAVRHLLYRMRGRIMQPVKPFEQDDGFDDAPDRIWISKLFSGELTAHSDVRLGLSKIGDDELQGKVGVKGVAVENKVNRSGLDSSTFREVSSLLLVKPEMLMIGNANKALLYGIDSKLQQKVEEALRPHVDLSSENIPAFVGMFGGGASGRIMGLRIPTILMGVRIKNPESVIVNIDKILDQLNSKIGCGLIPHRTGVGDSAKVGISSTFGGLFNTMPLEQRPAIKCVGDWLLLASNAKALDSVVSGRVNPGCSSVWPSWTPDGDSCLRSSYLWSDLNSSGRSVRNALAVWSLSLSISSDKNKAIKKGYIKQAKEIIAIMQGFGDADLWVEDADGDMIIKFQLSD